MSVTKFSHEKLGRTTECIGKLADDFLCVFALILYRVDFAADSTVIELDARGGMDHSERRAFARTFLGHHVGDDLVGGFGGVVFGVDTNEVSSLGDVPDCFVPVMLFDETRVLFEKGVYRVVGTNGGERLGGPNPMDDYVFVLASARAGDGVKIKVALVGDGGPVDRINGVDNFVFVVEDSYIVVEDFLDLGEEVHMDESHFLGCISIFW